MERTAQAMGEFDAAVDAMRAKRLEKTKKKKKNEEDLEVKQRPLL